MGRGQYDRAAARAKREGTKRIETPPGTILAPDAFRAFAEAQEQKRTDSGQNPPWVAEVQTRDAEATQRQLDHMMDIHLRVADVQQPFARPGFPYENTVTPILNPHGQPITQADYDALVTKSDRLLRLCQTHGLMI